MGRLADLKAREDKCVEVARKRLLSQKRMGQWWALYHLVMFWYVSASVFFLASRSSAWGRCLAAQNMFGFAAGLIIGFIAGAMMFAGVLSLVDAIKWVRGDLTDQLLVEYHDCLISMHNQQNANEQRPPTPDVLLTTSQKFVDLRQYLLRFSLRYLAKPGTDSITVNCGSWNTAPTESMRRPVCGVANQTRTSEPQGRTRRT